MKRKLAISAFSRLVSNRVLEVNVSGESSEDSIDMQQAATSCNIDNENYVPSTNVTNPALESIDNDDHNPSTALPASFDCSTLPKEILSHEGCTL